MRLQVASVDVDGAVRSVENRVYAALGIMAENVLADCTDYTPYLTGAMRRSGRTRIGEKTAYVEWGTDAATGAYTRYQYEHDELNHNTIGNAINAPKAQGHWFEGAKEERMGAWMNILEKELKAR